MRGSAKSEENSQILQRMRPAGQRDDRPEHQYDGGMERHSGIRGKSL